MTMIKTNRLYLKEALETDIASIMEMERHMDNTDFVWKGSYEQHKSEIEAENILLFVIKQNEDDETVGFALIETDNKSEIFELRRIVISRKGKGYGREVMEALFKFAFEDLRMNRFWLDVYPDNHIGIKLYESVGMRREGVLRQNYKSERSGSDYLFHA